MPTDEEKIKKKPEGEAKDLIEGMQEAGGGKLEEGNTQTESVPNSANNVEENADSVPEKLEVESDSQKQNEEPVSNDTQTQNEETTTTDTQTEAQKSDAGTQTEAPKEDGGAQTEEAPKEGGEPEKTSESEVNDKAQELKKEMEGNMAESAGEASSGDKDAKPASDKKASPLIQVFSNKFSFEGLSKLFGGFGGGGNSDSEKKGEAGEKAEDAAEKKEDGEKKEEAEKAAEEQEKPKEEKGFFGKILDKAIEGGKKLGGILLEKAKERYTGEKGMENLKGDAKMIGGAAKTVGKAIAKGAKKVGSGIWKGMKAIGKGIKKLYRKARYGSEQADIMEIEDEEKAVQEEKAKKAKKNASGHRLNNLRKGGLKKRRERAKRKKENENRSDDYGDSLNSLFESDEAENPEGEVEDEGKAKDDFELDAGGKKLDKVDVAPFRDDTGVAKKGDKARKAIKLKRNLGNWAPHKEEVEKLKESFGFEVIDKPENEDKKKEAAPGNANRKAVKKKINEAPEAKAPEVKAQEVEVPKENKAKNEGKVGPKPMRMKEVFDELEKKANERKKQEVKAPEQKVEAPEVKAPANVPEDQDAGEKIGGPEYQKNMADFAKKNKKKNNAGPVKKDNVQKEVPKEKPDWAKKHIANVKKIANEAWQKNQLQKKGQKRIPKGNAKAKPKVKQPEAKQQAKEKIRDYLKDLEQRQENFDNRRKKRAEKNKVPKVNPRVKPQEEPKEEPKEEKPVDNEEIKKLGNEIEPEKQLIGQYNNFFMQRDDENQNGEGINEELEILQAQLNDEQKRKK